ncbi:MAG: HPP family protein [Atribacterota bacterium]|jgi:CBS-domain-containing membrane protein|nr:HPP family protein [Atribacterota bacterium]MDD4895645.1 HPP family protein [Atribacterota bacterium]MDD5637037.1 HPP family protein [Atribacterota bacterium]
MTATAFTIFVMPHNITTSKRNVLGGYIIGMVFGLLFFIIHPSSGVGQDAIYALAVACSMFTMTIMYLEHPPTAGTALGVVVAGFSIRVIISIIVGRY